MKNKIWTVLLALLTLFAVGCGSSSDDINVVNPGQGGGGNVNTTTFLRIGHLVPAAQNYDVYVNNQRVLNNITFSQFTDYLAVPANARLRVTPAGNQNISILDQTLNLQINTYTTLVATGVPQDVDAIFYTDNITATPGLATVRLVNASEGNNSVSLTQSDGSLVVGSVDFPFATNYVEVNPGTFNLEVRDLQNNVLVTLPGVSFDSGSNYSVYVLGQQSSQTLDALVVVDSTTQGINN